MKVLIIGASGLLGSVLRRELSNYFEVFSTGNSASQDIPNYMQFDLRSSSYEELIYWANPDIVIHSAAITDMEFCEKNKENAFLVNSFSIEKLLNATDHDVKIIYISTDAIFSNELMPPNEKVIPNPISVYGKSKELAEFLLIKSQRSFFIIRTTIVGLGRSHGKLSFAEWIIQSIKNKEKIHLFTNVKFTPISIWDLANEILFLIKNHNNETGILHISGQESCSRYDFGTSLLNGLGLEYDGLIEQGSLENISVGKNIRSLDQSLNCNFYQYQYNRALPGLDQTILSFKKHYYE